ncbi:MAG: hypothetical protein GXO90_11920 [FCB group bacterium]|nr:hypothetical protein [FCB group bacterium]
MKLTEHEKKILELVQSNPVILTNRDERRKVAEKIGLTEKTLRNRIADLKKYGVLDQKETDSNLKLNSEEINLFDFFSILWKRKVLFTSIIFITGIFAVTIALLLPVWYKATVVLLPPSESSSSFGAASLLSQYGFGNIFGSNDSQNRILSILKSRNLKEKVVNRFDLQRVYKKETLQETLESLDNHMDVDVGDEGQIAISVWDRDQDKVGIIANYMAECLDSINIALTIADARNNRNFIENRLDEILDSLNVLQDSLVNLMKTNNVLSLEDQVRTGVEQSAILNGQLIQKEIEYDVAKASTHNKDPKLFMLEKEISSIRQKLIETFQQPGPASFFIPKKQIPNLLIKMERIKRKTDYFTQLIAYMGPLYEKSKVEEIRKIPTIQYLDHARRPDKKDKPKRSILVILIVGFVGIISTVGIVMAESKKS